MVSAEAVLFEPRRQAILRLIWDQELTAGEIARAMPEVTFGAVSQHLKVLRDAGLVELRRDGRHRHYRARRSELGPVGAALELMWNHSLSRLKRLAERSAAQTRNN